MEDPGVVGRIILESGMLGNDWIEMAQDWESGRALANVVMSIRVP